MARVQSTRGDGQSFVFFDFPCSHQVIAWTISKLQEWHSSPLVLEDRSLLVQEEDNLEYCLTLLPR